MAFGLETGVENVVNIKVVGVGGSWQNDFLTRRNAAALKVCGDPAAQIAYKKAMRNLRARGVF